MSESELGSGARRWNFCASGALALSLALYVLFIVRHAARESGVLTMIGAAHLPVLVIAAVASLYAAIRYRSNAGLGLLVVCVAVGGFYLFFFT